MVRYFSHGKTILCLPYLTVRIPINFCRWKFKGWSERNSFYTIILQVETSEIERRRKESKRGLITWILVSYYWWLIPHYDYWYMWKSYSWKSCLAYRSIVIYNMIWSARIGTGKTLAVASISHFQLFSNHKTKNCVLNRGLDGCLAIDTSYNWITI